MVREVLNGFIPVRRISGPGVRRGALARVADVGHHAAGPAPALPLAAGGTVPGTAVWHDQRGRLHFIALRLAANDPGCRP